MYGEKEKRVVLSFLRKDDAVRENKMLFLRKEEKEISNEIKEVEKEIKEEASKVEKEIKGETSKVEEMLIFKIRNKRNQLEKIQKNQMDFFRKEK